MKRFLTILFSCLFTVSLYAYAPTDYYVSNSGSDSNDGLSSSTPKSRPEQITLSSNDAIYYERDGVWDSVAVAYTGLSDITIGAYGTGAKPIITCYDTLDYVSVSSNIYKFNHPLLEVDYYFHMPYTSRGTWKRFENNYGWLLDNDRNHYEMGRYQTAGTYSKLTTYSESDNTYFECLSLAGSESNDYHNGSSGKVQVDAWWAEAFLVGDYTDASGAFSISNLISASTYNLNSDYDHQMYLYNHTNYLDEDNEWASNDGTSTRDGDIWIYNSSDISGDNYFLPIDSAVFSLLNCSNVRISDLELQGGHQAAITAYGCDSMVYDSLMFKNVHCGVFSDDGGDQYYRYDSVMHSTNYGLFTQQGYNINIENYYAYDIGTSEGGGGDGDVSFDAIFVRFPDDSAKVSYSHIDSCGRNGIHFKGNTSGLVYKVTNTHVEKYLTEVQDGAAIYFSGSPGTTTDKYIRNCITSKGQYANDDFHCRNTINHSGIYLDTDQEGTIIDSNIVIDAIIGIKLNGTDDNIICNNKIIRATQWGISYVDYNFGYGGLGSNNDTIHNNIIVNNDADAYGIRYLAYTAIDGLDSYSDTNTFVNVQDATDQNINREINYSPSACSVPDWVTITEGYLGAGNAWEDESFVNFTNHFASVSGSIDTDQCVVGIANATESEQTVNLYDLTFYRADSIEMSGSITIQPYKGVELIYKSGTASNIDLLPYIIREDINEEAGLNYNRASRRIRYKGIQYKILYNNKLFEVWYGNPINITNDLRAVDAGTDAIICSDSTLQLIGTVSGTYDSLRWSSLTLDNDSLITPTNDSCNYTPASQDISDGSGYVRLTVYNDDLILIDSVNIDNYNCDSLIAYYPFTGNAGDSSGNGYDLTITNDTYTIGITGVASTAIEMSGNDSAYTVTPLLDSLDDWAVNCWVNIPNTVTTSGTVFSQYDDDEGRTRLLGYYSNGQSIDMRIGDETINEPEDLRDTDWRMITVNRFDDSLKLYLDANLVAADDSFGYVIQDTFFIGWNKSYDSEAMIGAIDEMYIYNQVLTQSSIDDLFSELVCSQSVDAGVNDTTLHDEQISLTATASCYDSVLWSGQGSFDPDNTLSTTYTPDSIGDHYLTITNYKSGVGLPDSLLMTVILNDTLHANLTVDDREVTGWPSVENTIDSYYLGYGAYVNNISGSQGINETLGDSLGAYPPDSVANSFHWIAAGADYMEYTITGIPWDTVLFRALPSRETSTNRYSKYTVNDDTTQSIDAGQNTLWLVFDELIPVNDSINIKVDTAEGSGFAYANAFEIMKGSPASEYTPLDPLVDASFYADFENNVIESYHKAVYIDEDYDGWVYTTPNPESDAVNSSNYVAMPVTFPADVGEHGRGELFTQWGSPFSTEGYTHIYQWLVYFPANYLDGVTIDYDWNLISQFVTSPCSRGACPDDICGSGGIFNEIRINSGDYTEYGFEFRAEPDCETASWNLVEEQWMKLTMEIKWEADATGYWKVWVDESLIDEASDVQTLPDCYTTDSECGIRWKAGLYDRWTSGADSVYYYIDDMELYIDKKINGVCPDCE